MERPAAPSLPDAVKGHWAERWAPAGLRPYLRDEGLSQAVRRVFVQLYKEGLIYKDQRLVNWDPKLQTAISDLEVQQREVKGNLWHFRYPIEGEEGRYIVVATTRPETMLGDTAVAVHPSDERYKDVVGKHAIAVIVKPGRKRRLARARGPNERNRLAIELDRIGMKRQQPALMNQEAHGRAEQVQPDVTGRRAWRRPDPNIGTIRNVEFGNTVDGDQRAAVTLATADGDIGLALERLGRNFGEFQLAAYSQPEQPIIKRSLPFVGHA